MSRLSSTLITELNHDESAVSQIEFCEINTMKSGMKNEVQDKIGQVERVLPHPDTFIGLRYQYETPFGEVYVVRFGEVVRVESHETACP